LEKQDEASAHEDMSAKIRPDTVHVGASEDEQDEAYAHGDTSAMIFVFTAAAAAAAGPWHRLLRNLLPLFSHPLARRRGQHPGAPSSPKLPLSGYRQASPRQQRLHWFHDSAPPRMSPGRIRIS
jgi:hypothetical protein